MNYYTLPKNNASILIHFYMTDEKKLMEPTISYSIVNYLKNIFYNLSQLEAPVLIDSVIKNVNTYEYIFAKLPDTDQSISKVKPESNIFYELLEIFHICNLTEVFIQKKEINALHLTPNFNSSLYCLNVIREDKNDTHVMDNFNIDNILNFKDTRKFDFCYFEFKGTEYYDIPVYIKNVLATLCMILKNQNVEGITILKVDNIYYKSIIDILYIFCGLYERVHIIKPTVSPIVNGSRYIVCKLFLKTTDKTEHVKRIEDALGFLQKPKFSKYYSQRIIDNIIPYYFLNRIEESNIIIGQQQIDSLNQVINIIKNKNREEKIEVIKRNHIHKCIQWCEKYKIPHNKFIEKTNIFLNAKNTKSEMCLHETLNDGKEPIIDSQSMSYQTIDSLQC